MNRVRQLIEFIKSQPGATVERYNLYNPDRICYVINGNYKIIVKYEGSTRNCELYKKLCNFINVNYSPDVKL